MGGIPALPTINPAAGLNNPMAQAGQAIADYDTTKGKRDLEKLQLQQQKELVPLQTEAYKQDLLQQRQKAAGQMFDTIGKALLRSPGMAKSAQVISQLQGLSQQAGVPLQLAADGSVDVQQFKTSWDTLSEKEIKDIMEMPPGPIRDSVLSRFSGVPDEVRTAAQYRTAKDDAALQRAGAYVKNEADQARFRASRIAIDNAKVAISRGLATAQERKIVADADLKQQQTQDYHTRTLAYVQSVQSRLQINSMRFSTLQGQNDRFAFQQARMSADQVTKEYDALRKQAEAVQNQLGVYSENGGDDPDQITAMKNTINQINGQLNDPATVKANAEAQVFLHNATNPAWVSAQLGQSSGKTVTTETTAGNKWSPPSNYVEGTLKDGTNAWQDPSTGAVYNSTGKKLN